MADEFDVYYEWLGIPPDEQPANHYRLLGISVFEGKIAAIENAADRAMAHVRTFQSGKHSAESQHLLNELAAAKICLLRPEKKAAYDARLRQVLQARVEAPVAPPPMSAPTFVPPEILPFSSNAPPPAVEPIFESGVNTVFEAPVDLSTPLQAQVYQAPVYEAPVYAAPAYEPPAYLAEPTVRSRRGKQSQKPSPSPGVLIGGGSALLLAVILFSAIAYRISKNAAEAASRGGKLDSPTNVAGSGTLVFRWPNETVRLLEWLKVDDDRIELIDGKAERQLPAGSHHLTAGRRGPFENFSQRIEIKPGEKFETPPPEWKVDRVLVLNFPETERKSAVISIDGETDPEKGGFQVLRTDSKLIEIAVRVFHRELCINRPGAAPFREDLSSVNERRHIISPKLNAVVNTAPPSGAISTRSGANVSSVTGNAITNGIGMKLAYIPAGEFMMGSPETELPTFGKRSADEGPQHLVRITKAFYIGVYEVTQGAYELIMQKNPSYFSRTGVAKSAVASEYTGRFPVENVSWNEAQEFCQKLSAKEGKKYRLPTEAEWEYACRAGTTTPFNTGAGLTTDQANFNGTYPYGATQKGAFLSRTVAVGTHAANAFGLYDMHGNVGEWCQDYYSPDYYRNSLASDPGGPASGFPRTHRGGGWDVAASFCRSAHRNGPAPSFRGSGVGFRVVCEADGAAPPAELNVSVPAVNGKSPRRDAAFVNKLKAEGTFRFPQQQAQVLCDNDDLRVSLWNNAEILYVQAFVWGDESDAQGKSETGVPLCDRGSLLLDIDADRERTANVDRVYTLSPFPAMQGLYYHTQVQGGTTGLRNDSSGRGRVSYVESPSGPRVRVDNYAIPLAELNKRPGDELCLVVYAMSPVPYMQWNSVGHMRPAPFYDPQIPYGSYHLVKLAHRTDTFDISQVPEGRASAAQQTSAAKAVSPNPAGFGTAVPQSTYQWPQGTPPPAISPFDAQQARSHQEAWAKHLKTSVDQTNSIDMKLVLIPPGEFLMGATQAQLDSLAEASFKPDVLAKGPKRGTNELPQHRVTISKVFLIGATEVTHGQFRKFVDAKGYITEMEKLGGADSYNFATKMRERDPAINWRTPKQPFVSDFAPVTYVSATDAMAFCNWLSDQEGLTRCYEISPTDNQVKRLADGQGYRLPTEAQWEYACRAGTTTAFSFGDDPGSIEKYGWSSGSQKPQPVGGKAPNPFNLFDMHGNVREWCQDWLPPIAYNALPQVDPFGPLNPITGSLKNTSRGGDFYFIAFFSRSTDRMYPVMWDSNRFSTHGFRVIRVATSDSNLPPGGRAKPR